jgi:IS6 family transposase
VKYLNNIIEQDHRAVRMRCEQCNASAPYYTAERTLEGVEALHMLRKGQIKRLDGRDAAGLAKFVQSLFGAAA